jgi:hypothetical protein
MAFFLFADAGAVGTDDLLNYIETQINAGGWDALAELNVPDWQVSVKNSDARRFGEAFVALFSRLETLLPAQRERLIAVVDGGEAKKRVPRLLRAHVLEIRKLRKKQMSYRTTMVGAKLAEEAGAIRIAVYCPEQDVERVREFAAGLMRDRGVKIPERPKGRPKKVAVSSAAVAVQNGDELAPNDAEMKAAETPMGTIRK